MPDDVEAKLEAQYAGILYRTQAAHVRDRRGRVRAEIAGLAVIGALVAANALAFAAAGGDYFAWFLDHGAVIALVFGVVGVAVELDGHPDLIAADPIGVVRGVSNVFFELSASLWGLFGPARTNRVLDGLLSATFLLAFALAMTAWALVVAPLQYFVNLVAGAPARTAMASSTTVWRVELDAVRVGYLYGPRNLDELADRDQARKLEEGRKAGTVTQTTFAGKPVTLTNAIAAALLFGASQLV